jgi:hypothetical protein
MINAYVITFGFTHSIYQIANIIATKICANIIATKLCV